MKKKESNCPNIVFIWLSNCYRIIRQQGKERINVSVSYQENEQLKKKKSWIRKFLKMKPKMKGTPILWRLGYVAVLFDIKYIS